VIDGSESVVVTFTGTFVGSSTRAASGSQNLGSFENSTGNPSGFIFGSNDDNSSTITVSDTNKTISGTIVNYQRWDFVFSRPVVLNQFNLLDVDSNQLTGGFRDIVAAERFVGSSVGAAGTGIDANLTPFEPTSQLFQSAGAAFTTGGINAIIAPLGLLNPSSTPPVNVRVDFGNTPLQAFSLYTFSDRTAVHRLSLEGSGFQIVVVPEPGAAVLVALGSICMLRRRR
jgi:hypothetical protein